MRRHTDIGEIFEGISGSHFTNGPYIINSNFASLRMIIYLIILKHHFNLYIIYQSSNNLKKNSVLSEFVFIKMKEGDDEFDAINNDADLFYKMGSEAGQQQANTYGMD